MKIIIGAVEPILQNIMQCTGDAEKQRRMHKGVQLESMSQEMMKMIQQWRIRMKTINISSDCVVKKQGIKWKIVPKIPTINTVRV